MYNLQLISIKKMAEIADVSVSTIRRWWYEEYDFPEPIIRRHKCLRFDKKSFIRWLKNKATNIH